MTRTVKLALLGALLLGLSGATPTQQAVLFSGPKCAQSGAFLQRASLSGVQRSAIDTMICGMVSDGIGCSSWGTGGTLDVLFIHAVNDLVSAKLNLCSNTTALSVGTVAFTAGQGFSTAGGANALSSQFNPATAGGNYTITNSTIGFYDLTSRTSGGNGQIGANNGAAFTYIDFFNGANLQVDLNSASFLNIAGGGVNVKGSWTLTRVGGAASVTVYRNGTSFGSGTATATAIPSFAIYIAGQNANGTASGDLDLLSASWIGGATTAAAACKLSNRINNYMSAVGVSQYANAC